MTEKDKSENGIAIEKKKKEAIEIIFLSLDGLDYNSCKEVLKSVTDYIKNTPLATKEFLCELKKY